MKTVFIVATLGLPLALALTGCGREEIEHYQVQKVDVVPAKASPHAGHAHAPGMPHDESTPRRLIAAIVPHAGQTWFFKLEGPSDEVAPHAEAFDRFLKSVRLGGPEIAWTLPEGWRHQPGSGMRYATLPVGEGDRPLAVSITRLGGDAGGVLANINRWRGQIGLEPLGEPDLPKASEEIPLDVAKATRVDMTGSGGSPHAMMPPPAPPAARPAGNDPADSPPAPIAFTMPPGWTRPAEPGAMSVATFVISGDGGAAKVTVIPLDGDAGGLRANVNRWRGQIGLAPIDDAALQPTLGTIEIAGATASVVDLEAPPEAEEGRQRIVGAVLARNGKTWFFKMQGPSALVGREKPSFETFLKSVRFP